MSDEELGAQGVAAYRTAEKLIERAPFDMPASPIDYILNRLEQMGIRAGEITGREDRIDYSSGQPVYAKKQNSTGIKQKAATDFNSGKLDVLVINKSGSTGISLHSSETFKDQKPRHMIIAQAQLDINEFMQTLGRIFRTGQANMPSYELLFSDLPAEKRPAAVLAKKMASLNANTTASGKSDTSFKDVPDFMNEFGDLVAVQVMLDNPDLFEALGEPGRSTGQPVTIAAVTGRIPILPVAQQEMLYELLETEYNNLMEQLDAMGVSPLEAKALPLDARLLEEREIMPAKDVGKATPFAGSAKLGRYSVKRIGKPYSSEKVRELIQEGKEKNPDMRTLESQTEEWLERKKEELSEEAFENLQDRTQEAFDALRSASHRFAVGTPVTVSRGETSLLGVVISFQKKGKTSSPVALGAWKVDVAVADAMKQIGLSVSQINKGEKGEADTDMGGLTIAPWHGNPERLYSDFDRGQSESREEALIATGNLLSAYDLLDGGRVITFTDQEGNNIPGVLLPKDSKLNEVTGQIDIPLTPEQAVRFLREVEHSTVKLASDRDFILARTGGTFNIAVPASRAKGQQYYGDEEILEAAGQEFYKSGPNMLLRGLDESHTLAVLQALQGKGKGFVADNNRERAKEIAQGRDNDTPSASLNPGEHLPPRRPGKGILLQRVREVAEALGGRAAGAARTEAVQSFKDLPERIRKIYRGRENSLEGVYDPQTKTVYLVADNLTSGARAADVWIHEQVVHHGLRGLLSGAEREALLNRLWRELGGMGNADIKELAERYGIDPRNDERGRLQVMEEYLASLAEKAGAKLLSPRQETLWQKIVEAVRSFWARIAERITGQPSAAARIDVDKLLASLGRYVMEGRQVRAGTGAYASIGRDLSPERAAWEQVRRDTEAWGRQVEEWKKDKGEASNRALRVGKTPDVLKKLGAKAQVMAMMPRNMDKIHNKKGISLGTIKRLPQALSDPLMVFKSATMADSLVVLTELEHQGENLIAAIHLNVKHDRMTINDIASVHDRAVRDENGKVVSPGWQWFKGQIEKGNLRYYDKNRSSRWFREHSGLQLPGVLNHESYRGVKILTEKDIVKPVSPETDADEKPLASLRSLRSILNMTPREAANALDEVEIARFFKTGDITLMQRIFMLPHWIAKQQASFAKVYERQLQRMDERAAALKKSLEQVPSMFSGKGGLPKEDMDDLRKLIWENEGKEIPELKGVDKLIPDEKLANGRSTLKVNPEFYAAYEKWLTGQLGSEAARNAMLEIRKSLDNDLLIVYNRMAEMSEMEDGAIAELRKHINHVHNYFPHHRYGEYFVQAKVGDEVVYREHYDAAPGMGKIKGDKKIAGLVAEYPGAKWSAGRNRNLPEDVFGKTMDTEAMEQIIKASVSKIADKEQAGKIEAVLHAAIADTFKARGFGSHSIGRKGIPGHEKEDILRVLYDYKAGLYGWLTKMDAASDFSKALSEIDARKSPGLWSYTSEYVENMLRNSDRIDRVTGNIKAVAFAWYLGLSLKTAAVNATQNFVVGVPRLSMDVQGGGWEWIKAAGDAIHDRVTGGEGKRLAEDEERLLQELIREAIITDAYMREARGKMNSAGASAWDKFTKALGWPMSVAEKFNRASLALAAYRAARNGKLTPKAREKYGIKADEAATWEQAKAFAKAVVLDAHFVYGKSNTPEWLRGSSIGRALSPVFTFRSFSANMLNMWHWALRSQGKEGKIFVAKSLASTIALGGLTAFPFYATAMALVQAVSGDDDNWTERIRESLPEEDWLRDIVCYGLPSLTGTYIGGSLKMETPITRGVTRGETPKEILADSMGDIFGIPYDLLIVKPSRVLDAQSKGNTWRMVEEAAPVFLKNAMQAYRLATEGQTTVTGRPINDPGEPGARRISTGEAIGKALGFQPLSSTKSYEAYAARTHADRVRSDKIDELTVLALRTRDTGQPGGRIAMMKALAEWNRKMAAEGKPYMRIKPEDVDRRVSVRRRENRATPRAMEQRERMRSVWGQ
jgi:hypothetical protein